MALKSWVSSANTSETDFPIENLPYGSFCHKEHSSIGVAIGDQVLNLRACASTGLLATLPPELVASCNSETLNSLMSLGPNLWSALRRRVSALLNVGEADKETISAVQTALIAMRDVQMLLPAQIGDYTDFYASIHHARRVGKLFRPDNPLLPNYKYVPIGYHGRASSIVLSGQDIRRPSGQAKSSAAEPEFGPSQSVDYELEVGIFIGQGNELGQSIPIDESERHIFGLCLVNDWSARDIQSWEYQPLGPFLAKNFATTISPWVLPLESLAPYIIKAGKRADGDPAPLPYLLSSAKNNWAIDIKLEVYLQSKRMREANLTPLMVSRGNLKDLYWTLGQLITHHASSGCNLRPGDLLATGTISGPEEGSEGCLLEMKHRLDPIRLPTGEVRTFLEDGDQVSFRGYCEKPGSPKIGFGECKGTILPANPTL
jgi:fumarylacetoacetase